MPRILIIVLCAGLAILAGLISASPEDGWKTKLESAVANADRFVVKPFDRNAGQIPARTPLREPFEIVGRESVQELLKLLEIDEARSGAKCKCGGDTTMEFYEGDTLVVSLRFAHDDRLKWGMGKWTGDALLTTASQEAIAEWFERHGYHGNVARYESRMRRINIEKGQQEAEQERFASFFPPSVRLLVNGPFPEWAAGTGDPERVIGERIAELVGDPRELAAMVLRALGVTREGMSGTSSKERRALAAIETVSDQDLLAALEATKDDPVAVLGAARLYYYHGLDRKLPEATRVEWTLRIARTVLTHGQDREKPMVVRRLAEVQHADVISFLHVTADGEYGTGRSLEQTQEQEPSLDVGALLSLAMIGERDIRAKVEERLKTAKRQDTLALNLCLALLGDAVPITDEYFGLNSPSISYAALRAVDQLEGAHGMDALIKTGLRNPWVKNEAAAMFDRITGQEFAGERNRKALIKDWWRVNGQEFTAERRRDKKNLP